MNLTEFAPAKVNLGLAVIAKLETGYHELDSLFVTLDVGDRLSFEARDSGIKLEIVGLDLPTNRENLVYRAAEMYLERIGKPGGVSIKLEKILPIAAGWAVVRAMPPQPCVASRGCTHQIRIFLNWQENSARTCRFCCSVAQQECEGMVKLSSL